MTPMIICFFISLNPFAIILIVTHKQRQHKSAETHHHRKPHQYARLLVSEIADRAHAHYQFRMQVYSLGDGHHLHKLQSP